MKLSKESTPIENTLSEPGCNTKREAPIQYNHPGDVQPAMLVRS
jgi:hypothetical protein